MKLKTSFLTSSRRRTLVQQNDSKHNTTIPKQVRASVPFIGYFKPTENKVVVDDGKQNHVLPSTGPRSILKTQSTIINRHVRQTDNAPVENAPSSSVQNFQESPVRFCQTFLSSEYRITSVLGNGSSSVVFKCAHFATGSFRAVKVIQKQGNSNSSAFSSEVSILKSLSHKNVLHFYEICEDSSCVFLVMDLYIGGDLLTAMQKRGCFSEEEAILISSQLLFAVLHCHKQRVVHRDIQPSNIMFKDHRSLRIVLVDFGLAKHFRISEKIRMRSFVGNLKYVAPEIIQSNFPYSEKCDEWSVGVVFYEMLCGLTPFRGDDAHKICAAILSDKLDFAGIKWSGISKSVKSLISVLLIKNPAERIAVRSALSTYQFMR